MLLARHKLKILLSIGVVVAVLFWYLAPERRFVRRLVGAIAQATEIDFASIVHVEYDRLYIFGPYSTATDINRSLGFDWPNATTTSVQMSDSVNLLVFVRNGKVAWWTELSRAVVDLAPVASDEGYLSSQSKFMIRNGDWPSAVHLP